MNLLFSRNIGKRGRLIRGTAGLGLLVGAYFSGPVWLSGALTGAGVFLLFEALLGWCLLRALHIKTPW
jgi:hypothetical protein